MGWIILGIAVFTEICWALSLKWAASAESWAVSAVPITLSFVNMALLAYAMREINAGTAYAIWTGLGAVGVIIGGTILFGENQRHSNRLYGADRHWCGRNQAVFRQLISQRKTIYRG